MKVTVGTFLKGLEQEIPLELAMEGDPVGIQVMPEDRELSTVAVAYEINERMVEQAAANKAELIVAFHPLIYPSLPRITDRGRVERCVISLIRKNISLYILHTAFDAHPRGSSRLLAEKLGLKDIRTIVPNPVREHAGMGALGQTAEPVSLADLAEQVRMVTSSGAVRLSCPAGESAEDRTVRRVGILAGSGMSFYNQAIAAGAEAFVTADVRYHAFHAANDGIPVIDPGHAESERFVTDGMAALTTGTAKHLDTNIAVIPLHEPTNPVRYFV